MWNLIVDLWNWVIFEPLLNLIAVLLAWIPGHNFGIALIIFTLLTRFLLYPVIRKQLLGVRKQKALQPEVNKIKKAFKSDRQRQSVEIMALYKRNNFNPFSMMGYLLLQLPILIGLYQIINRIAADSQNLVKHSYPFVENLSWMKDLAQNPEIFDPTLIGLVDLTRSTLSDQGFYLAAFVLVLAAAAAQFLVARQSFAQNPSSKRKSWRQIFREMSAGREPDSGEVSAAANRLMIYIFPALILFLFPRWSAALSLYVLLIALAQYLQQQRINKQADESAVKVEVDGQDSLATVARPLNAKQKKEQAAGGKTARTRRAKRVSASARTIRKGEGE